MALKNYKPVTPTLRQYVSVDKSELWKGSPLKILTKKNTERSGRNNFGHITVRHKSAGHKKSFRVIDFKRDKMDIEAKVERIEYDPNRTSFIALLKYDDGIYSYILAPHKINIGDVILSSKNLIDIKIGNAMPLAVIPIGTIVHNIEIKPGCGGAVSRSAGTYAQLVGKDSGYALLKMQSGEIRLFSLNCMATVGQVSNLDNKNSTIGKAGRSRWLGIRPTVRGVAMNPVDHPHGGGEGKTSGGRHPVSPTGKPTKGKITRKRKNNTNRLIVKSRRVK
ncbi:MAG: 50S ribosomal protein L2 [Alphaproteobacteria bacterium]|nr:50S ribosomal protein L2 [Alphaproteobacteria bacterium]